MRFLILGHRSASGAAFLTMLQQKLPAVAVACLARADILSHTPECTRHASMSVALKKHLAEFQPTHIINFLGSFSNDLATDLQANVALPHALLDAAQSIAPASSIMLIGSAAEYGRPVSEDTPVAETHPCAPLTAYGISKQMQAILVSYYSRKFNLNVKLARTFNILATGLSDRLFVGRMYRQIEEIRHGKRVAIQCGNLTDIRDYLPLSHVISDYMRILCTGQAGEVYNVCSGTPVSMRDLLSRLLQEAHLASAPVEVTDAHALSPVPKIFGSRAKIDALPSLAAIFADLQDNWT